MFENINPSYLFLAGLIVVIMTLMLQLRKRSRQNAEQLAKRQAAIKAAREAEIKRQIQMGEVVKTKVGSAQSDRMPMTDPLGTKFVGATMPRNIAKWETEIHQLGREIIGRLDSKMVAIQVLTQEATRAANRLELLIDHFEQLAKMQANRQQEQAAQEPEPEIEEEIAEEITATSLAEVLTDLESDLDRVHREIEQSTTLLTDTVGEVSVFQPVVEPIRGASLQQSPLPIAGQQGQQLPPSISLASVYEDNPTPAQPENRKPVPGSHLNLRKQVELLSDYGYEPQQIAHSLDISLGEVDLMLKLRPQR
ncbi:hypothetical protein FACS1894189_4680 [Planctomycetales bacterium]|nr:hypothetical protein FACS1894189_4680 [Planctomycetales bacterium]